MTGVGTALRSALRDGYRHSWRLVLVNAALSALALPILVAALWAPAALLLLAGLGPAAAALMHCAVTLARTEELRLSDALAGLRLHWRRGLALSALAVAVFALGGIALSFWARAGVLAWPLTALVLYLLAAFAVLQLLLWPLAVAERARPLAAAAREAGALLARRPLAALGLAAALALVNAAGLAAAVLPFLTMTIAYSFLAAAHFALPPSPLEEAMPRWPA